jgi:nicotinamidase-related amidase
MLLDAARSALLVVDIQERLAPAIAENEQVVARTRILIEAARRLAVPILVSEQYPQGLGHTIEALRPLPNDAQVIAKTAFSAAREPMFMEALQSLDRRQLVVCGMETHVCVLQTAVDLADQGFAVNVAADAVGSRHHARRELGLARMRQAGCGIVDSEMVVFEWVGAADSDDFRALSKMIR